MSTLKAVTDDSFEQDVLKSDLPVLVDFWAPWCGPCKRLTPILEDISGDVQSTLTIVKVDIEDCPVTAQNYAITAVPTLMIFRNGEVVKTIPPPSSKAKLLGELQDFI